MTWLPDVCTVSRGLAGVLLIGSRSIDTLPSSLRASWKKTRMVKNTPRPVAVGDVANRHPRPENSDRGHHCV